MMNLKVGDIIKFGGSSLPEVVTRIPNPNNEYDDTVSFMYADGMVDEMYVDNVKDYISWGDMKIVGHIDVSKWLEEIKDAET